eukprot:m51a1_g288 Adaptor protein complex 3 (AP-3), delta subunit (1226) ;mRNA; f:332502-337407
MAETPVIPRAEVEKHNTPEDAWVIVSGQVYDVTQCLRTHPPGLDIVKPHIGKDITDLFNRIHSKHAKTMLTEKRVGRAGPAMDALRTKLNKPLFEVTMTDLVRGIRANKRNEAAFISDQIQVIREELRQSNINKKANAILKLVYLQMLGYDMSWASFNVVEVMSCPKFTIKRIGYLAASQSFHDGTEVLMLITNLLKKDMATKNMYDAGLALGTLSTVCTPDLARDLAADVVTLLAHSKPYIRKRAVLALYRIFVRFPDSLRPSFPRLRDRLTDADPSVSSAAVNVVCELARRNPRNYLALAPTLFEILSAGQTGSVTGARPSNWTLIKIIKLFGALAPIEPRLAKLLVEPMHSLINSTPATSLMFECIQTCIAGLSAHLPTMKLCLSRLRSLAEDPDANLKYLALAAMHSIMEVHPKAVAEHRDMVMACLDDTDPSIRARALDLLSGMVGKKNLKEVAARLVELAGRAEGTARDELIYKLVDLCRANQFQHITDFEWYLQLLSDLTLLQGMKQGKLLAEQMMEVNIRVKVVRPFGVRLAASLLRDSRLVGTSAEGGACEVLDAAAWTVGEFYAYLCTPGAHHAESVEPLLQPRAAALPPHVQATFMHAALKVFAHVAAGAAQAPDEMEDEYQQPTQADAEEVAAAMASRLPLFAASAHLEVQERACFALECVKLHAEDAQVAAEIAALFEEPLLPVAKGAQRKVPLPEGLDLDTPMFAEDPREAEEEALVDTRDAFSGGANSAEWDEFKKMSQRDEADEGASRQQQQRKPRRPAVDSVYMLGSGDQQQEEDDIPVTNISENLGHIHVSPAHGGAAPQGGYRKKRVVYKVDTAEDAPEGADSASTSPSRGGRQDKQQSAAPEDALAAISLDEPLRPDEELPVQQHRVVKSAQASARSAPQQQQRAVSPSAARQPPVAVQARPGTKANPSPYILGGVSDSPKTSSRPGSQSSARAPAAAPAAPAAPRTASLIDLGGMGSPMGSPQPQRPQDVPSKRAGGRQVLCRDNNVEVAYELRTNPAEKTKLLALLHVTNRLADAEVGMFTFATAESDAIAMVRNAKFERAQFVLHPGHSAAHNLLLAFKGVPTAPMQARGTIKYQVRGRGPAALEFAMAVPASTFVQPVGISKEDMAALIKAEAASLSLSSATVAVPAGSAAQDVIATVAGALHVEAVGGAGGRLMYGKTLHGLHVAILIKEKPDGKVQFDFKCSDAALARSLAEEVGHVAL